MSSEFDPSEMLRRLGEAKEAGIEAAKEALDKAGEHILGDAQQLAPYGGGKYSPHDPNPGRLQDSGITLPAEVNGTKLSKVLGFNVSYAAVQHENLIFRHDKGQSKYLEAAMKNGREGMLSSVADAIKRAMEG